MKSLILIWNATLGWTDNVFIVLLYVFKVRSKRLTIMNWLYPGIFFSNCIRIWLLIYGALRDLVPFVQSKKRGKHPWRSVTKIYTPPWVFFTFFKLYNWYQIVQRNTNVLLGKSVLFRLRINSQWKQFFQQVSCGIIEKTQQ